MECEAKQLLLKDYLFVDDDVNPRASSAGRLSSFCLPILFEIADPEDVARKQIKQAEFNERPPIGRQESQSAFRRAVVYFSAAWFGERKGLEKAILPSIAVGVKSNVSEGTKKGGDEIQRWKSLARLLEEDSEPLDRSENPMNDGGNSGEWREPDAIASGGKFEADEPISNSTAVRNGVVQMNDCKTVTNDDVSKESAASCEGSTSSSSASTTAKKKQWSNEELSPESVLICPFDDADEAELSSTFDGAKRKIAKTNDGSEPTMKREEQMISKNLLEENDRYEFARMEWDLLQRIKFELCYNDIKVNFENMPMNGLEQCGSFHEWKMCTCCNEEMDEERQWERADQEKEEAAVDLGSQVLDELMNQMLLEMLELDRFSVPSFGGEHSSAIINLLV